MSFSLEASEQVKLHSKRVKFFSAYKTALNTTYTTYTNGLKSLLRQKTVHSSKVHSKRVRKKPAKTTLETSVVPSEYLCSEVFLLVQRWSLGL